MSVRAGPFGATYAGAYDLLYEDKDYAAECDLLERVFARYGQGPVRRVLDLGCGTGSHAVILAERGYAVVGVDRSPHMLERARARTGCVTFVQGEIDQVDLGQSFDAVLMMFAVLGYHTTNAQVAAALASVARHLRPGGLFVCDVWYGPAVVHQRPSERIKVVDGEGAQVIRAASSELDLRHQVCRVGYRVWQIQAGQVVAEQHEQHVMRFFFALELEQFLTGAGLELLRLSAFPDLDAEPDETTWNVAVVARRAP